MELNVGDKILHESWYVGKRTIEIVRVTKTMAFSKDGWRFKRKITNGIYLVGGNGSNKFKTIDYKNYGTK